MLPIENKHRSDQRDLLSELLLYKRMGPARPRMITATPLDDALYNTKHARQLTIQNHVARSHARVSSNERSHVE